MANYKYIIEGNTVTREEVLSTKMVALDGLLPHLTSYVPVELSPLPKNCRYLMVKPRDNMGLEARVIVEHDPMVMRINHKEAAARTTRASVNYRLMMPHGFFWFNLKGNRMVTPTGDSIIWSPDQWGYMWSNLPFTTISTTIAWGAKLPNCWSNGTVCFGSTSVQANQQLGHFIDAAINTFWTSEFNNDISVTYPYPTLTEWQRQTELDPDAWRTWPLWSANGRPIKAILEDNDARDWSEPIPSSTDSPIPPLRILPTFWNLQQWLDDLSLTDRERLRTAING